MMSILKSRWLLFLISLFLLPVACQTPTTANGNNDRRPNVIVVMMDDFGAELLGSYGGTSYDTPTMDRLAENGVRFTNAYTTPLCTPTRVQIMSGQYPFRNGWTAGIWNRPKSNQVVPPEKLRMGQVFRDAGYHTAVAGKWQLARFDQHPNHPDKSGFDAYSLWTWLIDTTKFEETDQIKLERKSKPSRFWNAGVWEDGKLLREVKGKYGPDLYNRRLLEFIRHHREDPFFVYYPMALTHNPYHNPPPRDGRQADTIQQRFRRMVHYTDQLIGRIVKTLEEQGLRENTLILVTGDNGTPNKVRSDVNGKTVPGGKGEMTEAGTRVPMIANWPGTVPAGAVSNDPVDTSDVLPTIADAAGISISPDYTMDGRSFLPQLKGKEGNPRDWVFVQLRNRWFLRSRRYRLDHDGTLYDMSSRYDPKPVKKPLDEREKKTREKLQKAADNLLE